MTELYKCDAGQQNFDGICEDDHITVLFFPGFQLPTGKKGRFLYDLVRAGSQPGQVWYPTLITIVLGEAG